MAAADSHVSQEELGLLEMIHHHLDIDRLSAVVIEHSSHAYYILPRLQFKRLQFKKLQPKNFTIKKEAARTRPLYSLPSF